MYNKSSQKINTKLVFARNKTMMACCITGKSKPTGAMFEDQNMISGDDNNDNNDTDSVSIAVPIMPMIMASQMIYEYADIRKIVLDQDVSFNRDLNFLQRWRKGVVTFRDVELISVRAEKDVDGEGNRNFKGTHLQRTVRAEELLQFVQQNRKYFYSIPIDTRGYVGFDRRGTNDVPLNIEISLETYIEAHSHASTFGPFHHVYTPNKSKSHSSPPIAEPISMY